MQHRRSFETLDNEGKVEVLHISVEMIEITSIEGRSSVEGAQLIHTADGQAVDRLDRGKFRVRSSGRLLYCDPD